MVSRYRIVHTRVAALAAGAFAFTSLSHAVPPSPGELQSKVDSIAADFLSGPGAVGLSIGVARKGRIIVAKGYGLADAEFDVPADKDTMFRIGSVTKQFTAAAIMRLVEQGKLSLEDNLSRYLPDFPRQGHTVTVTCSTTLRAFPVTRVLARNGPSCSRWNLRTMRCSRS